MAIVPTLPERDANPAAGRKQDRSAFAEAFGGEVRQAEKKALVSADGREKKADGEESETLGEQAPEPADAAAGGPAAGATRDVLGLLAAAAGTAIARETASPPPEGPARASRTKLDGASGTAGEGASLPVGDDLPTDRNAVRLTTGTIDALVPTSVLPGDAMPVDDALDALGPSRLAGTDLVSGRGRARLEIVHQETHFEPTMREAVLVEKAPVDTAQRAPTRSEELLQMLSGGQGAPRDPAANQDNGRRRDGSRGERSDRAIARESERAPSAPPIVAASSSPSAGTGAAPAAPVALQVATRIVDAFQSALAPDRPLDQPAGEAHLRLRAGGAALKTLTIQLQPEHLGTVHISMRLQEGRLTLELATSRAETARTLIEDKAGLKALLETAGFSLEEASITVVARDMSAAAAPGAGARDPDGNARGGDRFADPQGNGRDGRPQDDGERRRSGASPFPRDGEAAPQIGRRSGSVFL